MIILWNILLNILLIYLICTIQKMIKDMNKRWKIIESTYESTMKEVRQTEYPKRYQELQQQ